MGDSISEAFTEYDLLNASSVVAKIGVELDQDVYKRQGVPLVEIVSEPDMRSAEDRCV